MRSDAVLLRVSSFPLHLVLILFLFQCVITSVASLYIGEEERIKTVVAPSEAKAGSEGRGATLSENLRDASSSRRKLSPSEKLFSHLDRNDDQVLSMFEFLDSIIRHGTAHGDISYEAMASVFSIVDTDFDGMITIDEYTASLFPTSKPATSHIGQVKDQEGGEREIDQLTTSTEKEVEKTMIKEYDEEETAPKIKKNGAPEQIHLALTGDPTTMLVQFVILGKSAPRNASVIVHGLRSFPANATTYDVPSRWWEPQGWQGYVYTSLLTGLEPGQKYTYHITTTNPSAAVAAASSPSATSPPQPTRTTSNKERERERWR